MSTTMACHCGRPVVFGYDDDPSHTRGLCRYCDAARCDAYPQDCPYVPQNATQEPRTASDGTPTPCGCVQALRDEAARRSAFSGLWDAVAFLESRP